MILPTKRLPENRSILVIGANILRKLEEPKTTSRLWEEVKRSRQASKTDPQILTYDWFVLALDFLFILQAVDIENGRLRRRAK